MAVTINGKRVNIRDEGEMGHILKKRAVGNKKGRRAVQLNGMSVTTIVENKRYYPRDLSGKNGKIISIPDRSKGGFEGTISNLSKGIIKEQVLDIAKNFFHNINYDTVNLRWMEVPNYKLPKNWGHIAKTVKLRVYFPTDYPASPPIGFYLDAKLPMSANGHMYSNAYHEAYKKPLEDGFQWYCVYIKPGAWQPAKVKYSMDWKRGDDIYTYFTLIGEVLESGKYDD